jgi:hypothetical protein
MGTESRLLGSNPPKAFSTDENRPTHSSANSDYSPCSSKTKLFDIEFTDLHVSIEDSVKPWCDQLKCQLFEAEYLPDGSPYTVDGR